MTPKASRALASDVQLRLAKSVGKSLDFHALVLDRYLWPRQREIVEAVATYDHVAIKGCHACGKTHVASGCPLETLFDNDDGKAFITAPTLRQVKTFVGQIELARQRAPELGFPECSTTGLKISEDRYILGASSSRGVNIQGLHGRKVLIVADEAPGIAAEIWDAIEGIRAGGDITLLELGNPVVPSGHFFDNFSRHRSTCHCITISAFDTPNLRNKKAGRPYTIEELLLMSEAELDEGGKYGPYPYLVTRKWVRDRYIAWGPNHPKYQARVLGIFPTQSEWAVFSLEWIEKAKRDPTPEEIETALGHFIQVGIDVAGGGDDETTLAARVDGMILEQREYEDRNPGGKIIADLREIRHKYRDLYPMGPIVMDIVGVGLNLAPIIADAGFYVVGFQAGSRPRNQEQFADAKSEAYWASREFFSEGLISGLNDEETEAQLSTIMHEETTRGKTKIESKDDARDRGVRSPDRAEAIIQALMPMIPAEQRIEYGEPVVISPI